MKFVYASIVALASAKSIINPKPYLLDERPEPLRPVSSVPANDCHVNPWILLTLVNQWDAANSFTLANGGLNTVMKSLQKCKDNDHVKEIFTLNYVMKKKPELYTNLITADTVAPNQIDRNADGTMDKVVDLLQITDPAATFSTWSDSKVFVNMYKWNMWNNLYNQAPLQRYQYVTRKVDAFKDQKAKALAAETAAQAGRATPFTSNEQKLMQLRDYLPFAQPVIKKLRKGRFGN